MADRELLQEAITALGRAADEEESIRFGHDVARVLHTALVAAQAADAEPTEAPPHEHDWATLGWDRPGGGRVLVVQLCACGLARELPASLARDEVT
jgi:hypothetical protein